MWCLAQCSTLFLFFTYVIIKFLNRFINKNIKAIAFFHPYASAGGGGERVLWRSVKCMQDNYPNFNYFIFTGDQIDEKQLIENVERSFKIKLTRPIKCIQIKSRFLIEAKYYKMFTLLFQSLASIILAIESLIKLRPFMVIDTMGYAFTYWLFWLFGCKVVSYTHYPTISTDMLDTVTNSEDSFNNRRLIARSRLLTQSKIFYYRAFAKLYGFMGRFAHVVMVNSSWTLNHINQLWNISNRTHLVYPPCNTEIFSQLELDNSKRNKFQLISIAQFRPEKNHKLQIQIIDKLLTKLKSDDERSKLKLVLVGSVRDALDQARVDDLKELIKNLDIERNIEFKLNIPFTEMIEQISLSNIGLHTMKNEHFGIAIVESMAAGLIMVAHNSAGPQMDIIDNEKNGYLASTVDEYANVINDILEKDNLIQIRKAARAKSTKFSDFNYDQSFLICIKDLINQSS